MNRTTHRSLAQGCDTMLLFLNGYCQAFLENCNSLPEARRNEISRLGSAMWKEITDAKQEALAQSDSSFQQFRSKVVKPPRKNSRLWREIAG